jgi:hypothetical protein
MGTNSAGKVSSGNDGKTDMGRGSSSTFTVDKGQRNTGKVGSGPSSTTNSNKPDDSKVVVSDPRLA